MAKRDYKNGYFSVTEVLNVLRKPGLEAWYKNNTAEFCNEESNKAKLIGKQIHSAIENYILTGEAKVSTEYNIEITNALKSFMLFRKEHPEIKLKLSEIALSSKLYKFNGTIDAPCPPSLCDWKTGKSGKKDKPEIYFEYKVQTATYINLWNENYPENAIDVGYVIPLSKDKISYNFEPIYKEEINDLFHKVFLPALTICTYQKERHFYGKSVAVNS